MYAMILNQKNKHIRLYYIISYDSNSRYKILLINFDLLSFIMFLTR